MKTVRMLVLMAMVTGFTIALAGSLAADPCLVVYPNGPCTYHYDPAIYYTVGPGDPLYDPLYDRGGQVLLRIGTNDVDLSIYQAPYLTGFISDSANQGYFFDGTEFDLIIDGFSNNPTTYVNILVIFDKVVPSSCVPEINVDGSPLAGGVYAAGDLIVSTPTPYGNNYSDVVTHHVDWRGCYGMHIWAFSDENYNGKKDGEECFTAFSHDVQIPVKSATWGAVKSMYR
jgi:hypothetical protein